MLIDDVVEFLDGMNPLRLPVARRFRDDLIAARRCVLEEDATRAAAHAFMARPSSIEVNLAAATLPEGAHWIEFPDAARRTVLSAFGIGFIAGEQPERVGYLLQPRDGGRAGTAAIFWRHAGRTPSFATFDLAWTFAPGAVFGPYAEPLMLPDPAFVPASGYLPDDGEVACHVRLMARFDITMNPLAEQVAAALPLPQRTAMMMEANQAAASDTGGEVGMLASALLMLNCADGVARRAVAPSEKLNRARVKKGRRSLLDAEAIALADSNWRGAYAADAGRIVWRAA